MEEAARFGVLPAQFWPMTPREFAAYCRGQGKRIKYEQGLALQIGWHAANYGKAKRMPDLARALRKLAGEPRQEQTPAQGVRIAEVLNQMFGGEDRRSEEKKRRKGA